MRVESLKVVLEGIPYPANVTSVHMKDVWFSMGRRNFEQWEKKFPGDLSEYFKVTSRNKTLVRFRVVKASEVVS